MRTLVVVICLALALSACNEQPTINVQQLGQAMTSSRVTVTRLGVFEDDLAYNNRRVVYLIVDQQTGAEYIGISGIGISEVGTHKVVAGKVVVDVQDER